MALLKISECGDCGKHVGDDQKWEAYRYLHHYEAWLCWGCQRKRDEAKRMKRDNEGRSE